MNIRTVTEAYGKFIKVLEEELQDEGLKTSTKLIINGAERVPVAVYQEANTGIATVEVLLGSESEVEERIKQLPKNCVSYLNSLDVFRIVLDIKLP